MNKYKPTSLRRGAIGSDSLRRGAIVAMTSDRIIGAGEKMLWHYSEDLQRFKQRTLGCAVIMGRITWDSIGRKPLPGRRNIVISRGEVDDVEHYRSVDKAIAACGNKNLWVIGGAQIYKTAMKHLNMLDITWVPDDIHPGNAVKFPTPSSNGNAIRDEDDCREIELAWSPRKETVLRKFTNQFYFGDSREWELVDESILPGARQLHNFIFQRTAPD